MRTIYLCTCRSASEEEKLAFPTKEQAETFLADCIEYAMEEEEIDAELRPFTKKNCLDQWLLETDNYYASIEAVEMFE